LSISWPGKTQTLYAKRTVFIKAANGHLNVIQRLFKEMNITTGLKRLSMMKAIEKGHLSVVDYMLNVLEIAQFGNSGLEIAIKMATYT